MWDRLVGPEATRDERGLVVAYALLLTIGLLLYVQIQSLGWRLVQHVVVALFALDIAGGIVANTTVSGVLWWHRPSQGPWDHLRFVSVHVHSFVLAAIFESVSWGESALIYGFLVTSACAILLSPPRLHRPIALLLVSAGVLTGVTLVSVGPELEWFVPFLYIKLIGGHLASG